MSNLGTKRSFAIEGIFPGVSILIFQYRDHERAKGFVFMVGLMTQRPNPSLGTSPTCQAKSS